ncbi:MAG: pyridoxal phosphate-dependent decarboxylase family protein [Gaiellaceae bacterium]
MPSGAERAAILFQTTALVDNYLDELVGLPVSASVRPSEVRAQLARYDFEAPIESDAVLADCAELLTRWNVHNSHPRYFGLFNPPATIPSIAADLLVAGFNPQLAVWSAAPSAAEIERHVLAFFLRRTGLDASDANGHFTSGGTEANLTALLCALARACPAYPAQGLRGVSSQPLFYVSAESHLAWLKIAQVAGLGRAAVRFVPTTEQGQLDVRALEAILDADRRAGHHPIGVVGTAGTTNAGAIDPLSELADLAEEEGLWFHVDAAWAGSVVLSDRLRGLLDGLERADSTTIDAHKWLCVPMGAGMFLTRDREDLVRVFGLETDYMPAPTEDAHDSYAHSLQWSRRFTGLKVFAALAVAGRSGYAALIEEQLRLGDLLREGAKRDGWAIANETPLPLVCLRLPKGGNLEQELAAIVESTLAKGDVWVSLARTCGQSVIRACITSIETTETDLELLLARLLEARLDILSQS